MREFLFSVIIPQRNSVDTLPRLLKSIPNDPSIEILIVDNSPEPIKKNQIKTSQSFTLLWSAPERHAGGARNVGVENAHGKWIIFADADDYFTNDAFEIFSSNIDIDADVIYYRADGVYLDTGRYSSRAEQYCKLIEGYIKNNDELSLRLNFSVPWAKMIKRSFINQNHLLFDEIRAGNDIYFSTVAGFLAKRIGVVNKTVYVVSVSKGSLTQRRDYEVIRARLISKLHCNQFLKAHNLGKRQHSVMFAIAESRHLGIKSTFEFVSLIFKYKQNPFIHFTRWFKTAKINKRDNKKNSRYIVN